MTIMLSEKQCLFVHIPRTGGEWTKSILKSAEIETSPWLRSNRPRIARSHQLIGHFFNRRGYNPSNAFSFVRHPLEYYESVWMYLCMAGERNRRKSTDIERFSWSPHTMPAALWCDDFKIWVESMLNNRPSWYSRVVDMYVGPDGGEFCQYIGRTERINKDLIEILVKFGYQLSEKQIEIISQAEKRNISFDRNEGKTKLMLNWTDDLRDEVMSNEKEVIDRFYGKNEDKVKMY